jgi:hypothetical protein
MPEHLKLIQALDRFEQGQREAVVKLREIAQLLMDQRLGELRSKNAHRLGLWLDRWLDQVEQRPPTPPPDPPAAGGGRGGSRG